MKRLSAIMSWVAMTFVTIGLFYLIVASQSSLLPQHWNLFAPLDLRAPVTFMSEIKLSRPEKNKGQCTALLERSAVKFEVRQDFQDSQLPGCGISRNIVIQGFEDVRINPTVVDCALAIKIAQWVYHDLNELAQSEFDQNIAEILHVGTYNCRYMRTSSGQGTRLSQHSYGRAFDVSGFVLTDGRRIILARDWQSEDYGTFLRAANLSACRWFSTVLGPKYNALHADHFHLDLGGWGICR